MTMTVFLSVIAGLAVGVLIGFMYQKNVSNKKYKGALSESERIISEAVKKAEQMKRDIVSEGKEEIHRLRQELDRDTKERRNELQRSERRLEQKEDPCLPLLIEEGLVFLKKSEEEGLSLLDEFLFFICSRAAMRSSFFAISSRSSLTVSDNCWLFCVNSTSF